MNRLSEESSPYLLQHAGNPVDWYPWGDEALDRARDEDKPIFLSIGYSACHWCHVMAHESFENDDIAAILNEHFISIKVDREERPDVDALYMTAVQMMTGSGGWPLSAFLTPDQEPFFGGTYFPPVDRYGRPGFATVLKRIATLWEDKRKDLERDAVRLSQAVSRHLEQSRESDEISPDALPDVLRDLKRTFDPTWGGFGPPPKFPPSAAIDLLLRAHLRQPKAGYLAMAEKTLDAMAAGGMYDQLGGGFHRYSVDEQWRVPHFEKMLYDNALLSRVYLDAYVVTDNEAYRDVAVDTLDYVLREMRDDAGGFHAAEDADSEGEEGRYYVWRSAEIDRLLGADATLFKDSYGVTDAGNFEGGTSILHTSTPLSEIAARHNIEPAAAVARLGRARDTLRAARSERVRPGRDDKIIVAWNALMISSLSRAYQVLGEERFIQGARDAATHILEHMKTDGGLVRSARHGRLGPPAYLDDYAAMAGALIDLYESTFDPRWYREARDLVDRLAVRFHDADGGGFFMTSAQHSALLSRSKPFDDGAVPSGNALASMACLRMARLTGQEQYAKLAEQTLKAAGKLLQDHPSACRALTAVSDTFLSPPRELVIVGPREDATTKRLIELVQRRYDPYRVVAFMPAGDEAPFDSPLFEGRGRDTDAAALYVCENYACRKPLTDPDAAAMVLAPANAYRGAKSADENEQDRGIPPDPNPGSVMPGADAGETDE